MRMLRARLLSLVLTILVGLGLVSSVLAHPLPNGAERALQVLQAAGIPVAGFCGQTQDSSRCADDLCPMCPGVAAAGGSPQMPQPELLARVFAVVLPPGTTPVAMRLLLGHYSHGPPAGLN